MSSVICTDHFVEVETEADIWGMTGIPELATGKLKITGATTASYLSKPRAARRTSEAERSWTWVCGIRCEILSLITSGCNIINQTRGTSGYS